MKLKIKRRQGQGLLGRASFTLDVMLDLTELEKNMFLEYGFYGINVIEATKTKKIIYGLVILITSLFFAFIIAASYMDSGTRYHPPAPQTGLFIFLITLIISSISLKFLISTDKKLKDLIMGIELNCFSLLEIKETEKNIEEMAILIKKTLDDSAFYGGSETMEIERNKDKDMKENEEVKEYSTLNDTYKLTITKYKK